MHSTGTLHSQIILFDNIKGALIHLVSYSTEFRRFFYSMGFFFSSRTKNPIQQGDDKKNYPNANFIHSVLNDEEGEIEEKNSGRTNEQKPESLLTENHYHKSSNYLSRARMTVIWMKQKDFFY